MARIMLAPALALGAVLAASQLATAAEPDKALSGFTMTLGGKGTAAQAATAKDDTEEACCWRHRCCWGGGYGGYYGGGYGGYYGGSYYGGSGGYGYSSYYSYAPAYYNSFAYRPSYYRPYANYYAGYGYRGGWGGGVNFGVNGTSDDVNAPVMSLNLAAAKNPVAVAEPSRSNDFRYNGGPANPVPQVKPDLEPRTPSASPGLPVSFKKETANPYRYKAYGEK